MAKHLIIASYDGINTGNYGDSLIWHGTKTLLNSLNISENYVEISSPLEEINKYSDEERPVIFECVNILPHLAKRDLNFPGVVLTGLSFQETFERNKKDPRWGNTIVLQELEAKTFFEIERPRYKSEAEKYGYPVFEKADDAIDTCLKFLS